MTWYAAIPFVVLLLSFVVKIPIPYGMIAGSVFYVLFKGMSLTLLCNNIMNNLYTSYIILAVPLFIFAAQVMNSSETTDKIYGFANAIVGRKKGGLGYVNVLGSLFFAGMTGSAVADATGLGMIEIEAMRKEGYDDGFSCAITATSAVLGPTFPPSIPLIIYSTLASASVGKLFIGGIIPAIVLAGVLCLYVAYIAHKRNYPVSPAIGKRAFLRFTLHALPALLTPVLLLGGIYLGIFTPTEAGAIAAFYVMLISFFVYRTLTIKKLIVILRETVKSTGSVALIIGAAYGFSFIVTAEHIPDAMAKLILGMTTNKHIFLLLVNVAFLILGMFIDTQTLLVVFIPIVLPIVRIMGIDLIHFGVLITFNTMIGMCTPPFGMLLFVTSGLSGTPIKIVIQEALPIVAVMIILLFILTYVPSMVTWLPGIMG